MTSINIYGAFPTTTIGPFHYLYRITNLVEQKHYYGIRTSKTTLPQHDLGKIYFSSSRDKEFKKDQKKRPENYRYKVIVVSDSRQRVANLEIKLHQKFNVGINNKFYNRMVQTITGFDCSGKAPMIDSFGNFFNVPLDDPRIASGELQPMFKGMTTFKDKNGNFFNVPLDDPRIASGELIGVTTGMATFKNKNGNFFNVPLDDPRIASGELIGVTTGMKWIYNLELKQIKLLNPSEELPEDWQYGKKNFNETPSSVEKGSKWIYNLELKKNKFLKPGEILQEGWEYGQINETPPRIKKGSKIIHNPELKQNKYLKPDEILPEGWHYGRKRF